MTADGSGNEVWRINLRSYVPSMLVQDGSLYAVLDAGVATCRVAATGDELWKAREKSPSMLLIHHLRGDSLRHPNILL